MVSLVSPIDRLAPITLGFSVGLARLRTQDGNLPIQSHYPDCLATDFWRGGKGAKNFMAKHRPHGKHIFNELVSVSLDKATNWIPSQDVCQICGRSSEYLYHKEYIPSTLKLFSRARELYLPTNKTS